MDDKTNESCLEETEKKEGTKVDKPPACSVKPQLKYQYQESDAMPKCTALRLKLLHMHVDASQNGECALDCAGEVKNLGTAPDNCPGESKGAVVCASRSSWRK